MTAEKRNKYVIPQARDLSGLGVSGAVCAGGLKVNEPKGQCVTGQLLTSGECADGGTPVGGDCKPTGGQPTQGYCSDGGLATEGCWPTGSVHH